MTAEAAFIRAIIERPDDDVPRLVMADFLDERGDPRGEFIRVQVELAKADADLVSDDGGRLLTLVRATEERRDALRRRERELLDGYAYHWLNPLGKQVGLPIVRHDSAAASGTYFVPAQFSRGFVSVVTLSWADWVRHSAALLAACPIARAADGLVRLTDDPPWETWVSPHDDVFHVALRAGDERIANQCAEAGRETVARLQVEILDLAFPGVDIKLPAAGRVTLNWNDVARTAITETAPGGHLRPGVAFSVMRDATYRAILADPPEARP